MKIRQKFTEAFNILPGEGWPIVLLSSYSFMAGICLAYIISLANAFFLADFGAEFLPYGYVATGIVGYLVGVMLSWLQKKLTFSNLLFLILIALFVLTCLFRLGFWLVESKWLAFGLFVSFGTYFMLINFVFRSLCECLFNLRQSKRLFGLTSSGGVISAIIGFFSIPLFLHFFDDETNLLLIAAPSLLFCIWVLKIIAGKYSGQFSNFESEVEGGGEQQESSSFLELLKMRYVGLIFLMSFAYTISFYYLDYAFLAQLRIRFTDKAQLTQFIGIFFGSMRIVELVVKTFLSGRLLSQYGIKFGLVGLPLMVCFCTGLAVLAGIALEDAATVIFLLLALDKLIERVVARSFYEQSSNILFQPLNAGLRLSARTKEETMVAQLAVIPAGVTLLFFNWIGSLTLVINVLLVILIGWIFIAILMAREYKNSLQQHLQGQSEREKAVTHNENVSIDILVAQLDDLQPEKVIQALKLLERIDPLSIGSLMEALLEHPAPVVRTSVLQSIGRLRKVSCLEAIIRRGNAEKDPSVQDTATQTMKILKEAREKLATPDRIATLTGSNLAIDRLQAAQLLCEEKVVINIHHLLPLLLQDDDLEVRRCALAAVGRTDSPELWQVAMEHLSMPPFCNAAIAALAAVGEDVLPALDTFFARPSQTPATLKRIVRIYGLIGGNQALKLLIEKMNFPEKRVREQVIISLQSCKYQAKGGEFIAIKHRIEESVSNAAWSMATLIDIKDDENVTLLKSAVASEIDGYRKQGFILLSLIYEPQSIQLVQETFTSGSGGSKVYALELLDVFMDEDLKNILFPMFEDMSLAERLQLLEVEFPQQDLETVERLQSAINGEYTKVDRWTKACALYLLSEVAGKRILDEIIAALFHPDHMLRETAAWCLHRLDPAAYAAHLRRLPDKIQRELDALIRPVVVGQQNGSHTRITIENVLFLKKIGILSGVPERILAELVDLLDEVEVQPEETLITSEDIQDKLYILIEGQLRCTDNEGSIVHIDVGEIIGGLVVTKIEARTGAIIATKYSRLFYVDRDVFCSFIADNAETVSSIVNTAGRLALPYETESQSISV